MDEVKIVLFNLYAEIYFTMWQFLGRSRVSGVVLKLLYGINVGDVTPWMYKDLDSITKESN